MHMCVSLDDGYYADYGEGKEIKVEGDQGWLEEVRLRG